MPGTVALNMDYLHSRAATGLARFDPGPSHLLELYELAIYRR